MVEYHTMLTLHEAVETGHLHHVVMSLAHGANVHEQNDKGDTALHVAVWSASEDIVQHLVSSGANVNSTNHNGDTPLHIACSLHNLAGRDGMMHLLILCGSHVNTRNKLHGPENTSAGGRTPMHIAVIYASSRAVKILLDNGADVFIPENEGFNALHWAVQIYSSACHYENRRVRFGLASIRNERKIKKTIRVVQLLLSHGTNYSAKIALLRAKTDSNDESKDPESVEDIAATYEMKTMLQSALRDAEQSHRASLEAFAMGHHDRLGVDTLIPLIPVDVIQLILEKV